jgi:hypothetical protein
VCVCVCVCARARACPFPGFQHQCMTVCFSAWQGAVEGEGADEEGQGSHAPV